jgi:transposase
VDEAVEKFHPLDRRPLLLMFQDEGRFGRMTDIYRCWCPNGIRPVLKKALEREYTYVYSSIAPETGENFSLILPYADNSNMSIYLQELSIAFSGYRIVLAMDSASWHGESNLEGIDNISIIYQPPYSPEVNPVEHLWKYLRENYFGNRYWDTIEELEAYLVKILKEVHEEKEILASLTRFDWISY